MLLMIRAIAARAGSDPTQTWLTCLKLEFPGIATAAQTHSTEQTINTGTDLNFHMLCIDQYIISLGWLGRSSLPSYFGTWDSSSTKLWDWFGLVTNSLVALRQRLYSPSPPLKIRSALSRHSWNLRIEINFLSGNKDDDGDDFRESRQILWISPSGNHARSLYHYSAKFDSWQPKLGVSRAGGKVDFTVPIKVKTVGNLSLWNVQGVDGSLA